MLAFFKKAAPWLAAGAQFIPGAGPIIAQGLNAIAKTNNIALPGGANEIQPTVDAIAEAVVAISGHPEGLAALKAQNQDYGKQMQLIGFQHEDDIAKMFLEDRANARDLQSKTRSKMPAVLGTTAVLSLILGFVLLAFHAPPPGTKEVVILLIGAFGRDAAQVYAFYFGSSQGSEDKTKIIGAIAQQP